MSDAWRQWVGQSANGEFPLREYLGGSDHSAVFLTERGAPQPQKAAIKLIPADPHTADLQLTRWKLAAQLTHPQLLKIFQSGRCRLGGVDLLYLVMECAEENLAQILPERPLSPEEVREMLPAVLDTLAFVHGKGFVHGCLKPANILATGDQLKLSMDTLSRVGESAVKRAKPGPYDAPEMPGGRASTAADIWSLGMTLVEALTQRLPAWDRAGAGAPAVPETLPAPFLAIARSCLHRDPQHRATLGDIAARLRPSPPVPPAPQQFAAPRPQQAPAKRSYTVPALVVGFAVVAVFVIPMLLTRRPEPQPVPSVATRQPGVQAKVQPTVPAKLPPEVPPKVQPNVASKPEPKPFSRETAELPKRPAEKKPALAEPAPAPASPRTEAVVETKAHTAGRVHGEVIEQVLPDVSQKARDTIQGTVRISVRVHVDPSGAVTGAELESPNASKYFADLALRAARRWKFESPMVDGRDVPSEWVLRFDLTKTATKAVPVQTAP
jgi:TonB family protein